MLINKHAVEQMIDYEGMKFLEEALNHKTSVSNDTVETQMTNNETTYTNGTRETGSIHTKDKKCKDSAKQQSANTLEKQMIQKQITEEKCKYLYIYMDYDEQLALQIQCEQERNKMIAKLMRKSTKDIEIDAMLSKDHVMVHKAD
jgi:hypothetical protein